MSYPSTMTAARLHGPSDMRVDQIHHPGPPGPGQVLLRVTTTCICGSDLHSYKDARIGDSVVREPLVLTGKPWKSPVAMLAAPSTASSRFWSTSWRRRAA